MSIGAFFDTLLYVGLGIYMLYLYKSKKDKLGNKAKWVMYGGIAFIVLAIISLF